MFCKNQGSQLMSTEFNDGKIIWKEFENSITVIGIGKGYSEIFLSELVDLTFHAMVLCVGIEELRSVANLERLKRDLKMSFQVIDQLMESSDDILMLNDCVLCSESLELSIKLTEYVEQTKSPYICLMVAQKTICATEAWWFDLDVIDRKLLTILFSVMKSLPRDIPVFIPIKSPKHAYRFIAIALTQNLTVTLVCGPTLTYMELEEITQKYWRNEIELLGNAERCYPRNFSDKIELDSGILGILLINTKMKRFMISKNLQSNAQRTRLDILRQFYYQAILPIDKLTQNDDESICNTEQYWCSEYHKCHGIVVGDDLLCVLYISAIPTPIMRVMTTKLLETLTSDKETCWQL